MSLLRSRMPAPEPIHKALDEFFGLRNNSDLPLSVKRAVAHIKHTVRDCDLSEEMLADIVADHAILRGFNLHFDTKQGRGYGGPLRLNS